MSFNERQETADGANRIRLFLFEYGETSAQRFAYTDSAREVTFAGNTYVPTPISHGRIVETGNFDKTTLTVTAPLESTFAQYYRRYAFARTVSLVIYHGHADDPDKDFIPIWSGQVQSCKESDAECVISLRPVKTILKSLGLRRMYQKKCPHVLYGTSCSASMARVTSTTTATQNPSNQNKITLASGWASYPAARYVGGLIYWDNEEGREWRTIQAVSGNDLTLSGEARGIEGVQVKVAPGCRKITTDCADIHRDSAYTESTTNITNFGGMPWIPFENPIGTHKNQYF